MDAHHKTDQTGTDLSKEDSNLASAGSNQSSHSEQQQKLIKVFEPVRNFCRILQDAYVLVDASGRILKYNQMFCALSNTKSFQLRKEPMITDILQPVGSAEDLRKLIESPSPLRFDELALVQVGTGRKLMLIASSFPFCDGDVEGQGSPLGTCLLLRDVTAEASLQGKYTERTMESLTDPLTGLFSRRFIERLFSGDSLDAIGGSGISVLMCDIDHFKSINDTYGHLGGDEVLKAVAHEIRKGCRSTDRVVRYGGEEFAVILPDTPVEGACIVAEKIRRGVAGLVVSVEGREIRSTISIGGTERFAKGESLKSILSRADECLYKAKMGGRNRSIIARNDGILEASAEHDWQPLAQKIAV